MLNENISLRDFFAGLAMHAFHANPDDYYGTDPKALVDTAKTAYKQADAMLEVRKQVAE